ncbi:hypothetical protein EVAR_17768_1 [Eumeta japonica]|uniref:ATP-dependent DNA helicase n=1 Tax=Eumeta variegata TaxID=151549 RepID=A0A4C1TTQ1_EUMVA|nr:hypothetical protein EVAR_17768_1 [Eumeta japonica]
MAPPAPRRPPPACRQRARIAVHSQVFTRAFKNKPNANLVAVVLFEAFDCLNHDILIGKQRHYGVTGLTADLLKSYLSNRIQGVNVNGIRSSGREGPAVSPWICAGAWRRSSWVSRTQQRVFTQTSFSSGHVADGRVASGAGRRSPYCPVPRAAHAHATAAPSRRAPPTNNLILQKLPHAGSERATGLLLTVVSQRLCLKIDFQQVLMVNENTSGVYILDASGGAGKIFLINLLLAKIRAEKKIVIAVASSGMAANSLPGGKRHIRSKFFLMLERGKCPEVNSTHDMEVPTGLCQVVEDAEILIHSIYDDIHNLNIKEDSWLCARSILAPTNDQVTALNQRILDNLSGAGHAAYDDKSTTCRRLSCQSTGDGTNEGVSLFLPSEGAHCNFANRLTGHIDQGCISSQKLCVYQISKGNDMLEVTIIKNHMP